MAISSYRSMAINSVQQLQSIMILFLATPPKNIVKYVPSEETTKVIVIVFALLTMLILISLIVFDVIYVRRRNIKK